MAIRGLALLATLALLVACVDPGGGSPPSSEFTVGMTSTPAATATSAASATPTASTGTLSSSRRAPATPMIAMTEGPYYTANPPQRSVLSRNQSDGIFSQAVLVTLTPVITLPGTPLAARFDFIVNIP